VYPVHPVPTEDVHAMLRARYAHLRADADAAVIPPVTDDAVSQLYGLFRGDLRGLLSALEDGVRPNIGLSGGPDSFTFEQLRPTLQRRYADAIDVMRDEARIGRLLLWGKQGADTVHTQASLQTLWSLRQSAVSTTLAALRDDGYVIQLPRQTGEPTTYALSGVSRLAFA
jgi:DNA-binding transcriptional ArsR family regulator